jgi:hypothetical protein
MPTTPKAAGPDLIAGQLSELLVMLGHEGGARTLQGVLSAWQAAYQVGPRGGSSLGQGAWAQDLSRS